MAFSQIIRFTLSSALTSEFVKLRDHISRSYGVKDQYFGYMVAPSHAALPIKKDEICWVIQWPHDSDTRVKTSFNTQLSELAKGKDATSLLFEFSDTQISELTKALEAPICQFAIINLLPIAPQSSPDFIHSMHKTYTDCYGMEGFTGGEWAYATNTNDTSGVLIDSVEDQLLKEKERRLACYYLGWESIKHHQAATNTALFYEEMSKLGPWFGPGSGAWYVDFKKHFVEA